jgi:ABC-type uncharacterized transport system permease subunit
MIRLLGITTAVIGLVTGLTALAAALWAALPGALAALQDTALPPLLAPAVALSAAAATLSLLPGLAAATAIRHAGSPRRLLVFGIAICLMLLPAPRLTGWPSSDALASLAGGALSLAVLRGSVLVLLITAPAIAGITPGLRRAARLAGATPFLAWRHVVLAQIWRPACLGWLAAGLAALAQTPASGIVAGHLNPLAIWPIPAALLLIACSALALGTRPARTEPARQPYSQ